ncbi:MULTISPECIES: hypothetical protein [unclassified Acinetobacter]|uniref:hypothetical protein n=1 Tax=unclassified Acinetobacter TaxID=196816 RepID=UPI0025C54DEB|nr:MULTISPECIES: hypothetical protein [unclassified Acinetobacter]
MSKLSKIIVSILLSILVIVAIGYGIYEYQNKKRNTEIQTIYNSYRVMVPNNLNSYHKVKEYYNQRYRDGDIENGIDDYRNNSNMIQLTMDMYSISTWCEDFSNFSYENYEDNLKYWLDQEINVQDYQNINDISKASSSVPPVQAYLSEYKKDKKITYREYCSLPSIFNASTTYEEQLKMQAQKHKAINY